MSKKIIIFTSSFVISKGIGLILNELNLNITVNKIYSEKELIQNLKNENYNYLITDSIILKDLSVKTIKNHLSLIEIIIFDEKNSSVDRNLKIIKRISISAKKKEIYSYLLNIFKEKHNDSEIQNEISQREKEVIKYVAKGFTNKEIADKLFLSIHTITTHRRNITKKLDIKTISGLTIYAILNNIININET